jgi:hypothetical protein
VLWTMVAVIRSQWLVVEDDNIIQLILLFLK